MQIRHLLKSQANQVLIELKSAGWNPSDFKWEDTDSSTYSGNPISQLSHSTSGYRFVFDNMHGHFVSIWSPASETQEQRINSGS